jgi:hypothetical protein
MAKRSRPVVWEGVTFTDCGPPLKEIQFSAAVNMLFSLSGTPDDYLRFLRRTNGGAPKPSYFQYERDGTVETERVYRFLSVEPDPMNAPVGLQLVGATLNYRSALPRHAALIGVTEDDKLLLLYLWGDRAGQVWLIYPEGIDPEGDLDQSCDFIAKSFTAFLRMLYTPPPDWMNLLFALDGKDVRGNSLAAKLKAAGCTRRGNISGYRGSWPAWQWHKYKVSRVDDVPASVASVRNGKPGWAIPSKQRPLGHPLLHVTVSVDHADACCDEMAMALGDGAVLLEKQPAQNE